MFHFIPPTTVLPAPAQVPRGTHSGVPFIAGSKNHDSTHTALRWPVQKSHDPTLFPLKLSHTFDRLLLLWRRSQRRISQVYDTDFTLLLNRTKQGKTSISIIIVAVIHLLIEAGDEVTKNALNPPTNLGATGLDQLIPRNAPAPAMPTWRNATGLLWCKPPTIFSLFSSSTTNTVTREREGNFLKEPLKIAQGLRLWCFCWLLSMHTK